MATWQGPPWNATSKPRLQAPHVLIKLLTTWWLERHCRGTHVVVDIQPKITLGCMMFYVMLNMWFVCDISSRLLWLRCIWRWGIFFDILHPNPLESSCFVWRVVLSIKHFQFVPKKPKEKKSWRINCNLKACLNLVYPSQELSGTNVIQKERRHNTIHCITEYCDQCKANGLIFMAVLMYGRHFFFSFFFDRKD